jgi:hypothetical protein
MYMGRDWQYAITMPKSCRAGGVAKNGSPFFTRINALMASNAVKFAV